MAVRHCEKSVFAYAKKHARLQVDPDVDLMSDGVGVTGNTVSAEQEVLQQIGQVELLKNCMRFQSRAGKCCI